MKLLLACLITLCACHLPKGPSWPVTPEKARESTFKIDKLVDGTKDSSGTAWIVNHDPEHTYLITAGHVCRKDPGEGFATFVLDDKDGKQTPVIVLADSQRPEPDLCLLMAPGDLGPALLLAHKLPAWGEEIAYVGAPMGLWGEGAEFTPIYTGKYSGSAYTSAPAIGGCSGSAMFTRDGVFGVAVTVSPAYEHLSGFVAVPYIHTFLATYGLDQP